MVSLWKQTVPEEAPIADSATGSTESSQKRERIIKRAAQELKDGMYVNLGIGMPLAAPAFLPEGTEIVLESENGILGMGRYPKPGEEVCIDHSPQIRSVH